MNVYKKPLLGVMPRYIWDDMRREELRQAIYRRIEDGETAIPPEWVAEYNELIGGYHK